MGNLRHLNVGCADASIITTEKSTFLVDCHNIGDFSEFLPSNKKLKGVFITHQHSDHHSGLSFLRDAGYAIECLIYSPYERRYDDDSVTTEEWNEFGEHRDYFQRKGTKLFPAYRQNNWKTPYWSVNGLKFWMLGPERNIAAAETRVLHDASLVFRADLGKRKCTFTGDASDASLNYIAKNTSNICNDILHASHHGSINNADLEFVKKCNAKYTVISTASGTHEKVPHPTALKRYADHTTRKVYRTDDGTLKWTF